MCLMLHAGRLYESVVCRGATSWVIVLRPVRLFCLDCSSPSSSVHGIFQARILEWVAISFSREMVLKSC